MKVWIAAAAILVSTTGPQSANAFEPLTALTVKVGTSLVVKGFNYLLGKATQGPDLQFETIKQIHGELRAVRGDVLKNRQVQLDLHERATVHRNEIAELVINVGEGVKDAVERNSEMDRIIAVLGTTEKLLRTLETARKAKDEDKREEYAHTLETLREDLSRIERESIILNFSVHLRPVAILPRIGAIQARWIALQAMPATDIAREQFVGRAGNWLESQRYPTGEVDPVRQSLADLIIGMEHHVQGLARYLAELGRPCSPLWNGYLTVEEYEYDRNMIKVSEVGVSQAHLESVHPGRKLAVDTHYLNSMLVQPTKLVWSKEIVTLDSSRRLRAEVDDAGASIRRTLSGIHRNAFECEGPLSESARMRLVDNIPDVPGQRARTGAGQIPAIDYDQGPLVLEELVRRRSCGAQEDCRAYWEYIHKRLEAAKIMLIELYSIRREVNRTLEWLAAETRQAECTYWRDEPRVCVFGEETGSAEIPAASERTGVKAIETRSTVGTYQKARDWDEMLNQEQVGPLRYTLDRAAKVRAREINRLHEELNDQVNDIQHAWELNDRHLRDVSTEAARMAWVRLAVSVVQDQVVWMIESATEEAITAVLDDGDTTSGISKQWATMVLEEPSQDPEDRDKSDGSGVGDDLGVTSIPTSSENQTVLIAMTPQHMEDMQTESVISPSYSDSVYGYKSGLSNTQRLALWLPEIAPEVADTLAGVGDGMTLGITRRVREWVGISAEVDTESGEYHSGTLIGILTPGAAGAKLAGTGAAKAVSQLIRTGKASQKFGNYSVLMKAGHGQRTQGISLIRHSAKGESGRVLSFDVVTKLKGPGSLASKLPHMHIGKYSAHLPWEPSWLVPAVITSYTPKAD